MKATEFEVRHQALLRLLLITSAFLTYLIQPDDIVWALVKDSAQNRLLERCLFAVAALLIGAGAGICTWARAYPEGDLARVPAASRADGPYRYARYSTHLGNFLYSAGLGSLAPLWGFVILVVGQALLVFRLIRRADALASDGTLQQQRDEHRESPSSAFPLRGVVANWGQAVRQESAKWGLFVTMIVFTILLVDRVAEILAVASFFVWLVLNWPPFKRSPEHP